MLGQLGNKIQHALHAYTPAELKGAKAAAQSFRENPEFDTFDTLTQLGIGEALVSVLDESGVPTVVKRCTILPPQSQMGALQDEIRSSEITGNLLYTKYSDVYDRDSAYEFLQRKALADEENERKAAEEAEAEKIRKKEEAEAEKAKKKEEAAEKKAAEKKEAAKNREVKRAVNRVASSAAGTVGREMGNELGKKIGGTFGKKLGGNVGASLGRGILNTLFKL